MKNRLRMSRIDEVSLVDKGDNPAADVLIHKRAPDAPTEKPSLWKRVRDQIGEAVTAAILKMDGGAQTFDEMVAVNERRKKMQAFWDKVYAFQDAIYSIVNDAELGDDEAEKKIAASMEQFHAAVMTDMPTMKVAPEPGVTMPEATTTAPTAEDIAKRLDDVQKALDAEKAAREAAETRVLKMEEDRERNAFITKAQKFTSLPNATADDLGGILFKVSKALTTEEFAKLESVLAGAAEIATQSAHFREIGSDNQGAGSVEAEVTAEVEKIRKDNPKLTVQAARAQVWKNRPDLYAKYENERAAHADR